MSVQSSISWQLVSKIIGNQRVQEQASWVCQCEEGVIDQLQLDFKRTLKHQNSLEQWAQWLEGVTNRLLQPHEGQPHFAKAARQFLLK